MKFEIHLLFNAKPAGSKYVPFTVCCSNLSQSVANCYPVQETRWVGIESLPMSAVP